MLSRSRFASHRQLLANTIAQRNAMSHNSHAAARDPYTAKASSDDASLKTKLEELNTVTKAAKVRFTTPYDFEAVSSDIEEGRN